MRLLSTPPCFACREARDPSHPCRSPQPRKRDQNSWSSRRNHLISSSVDSQRQPSTEQPGPLAARRRVVLMLMLVVLSFLLCNLPYHARKMWQARMRSQPSLQPTSTSFYNKLFTPCTFLVMYLNSAINPVLYVTMSRSFQRAMLRRLWLCSRGFTAPLRLCCGRCFKTKQEPMPSPLIGALRHRGFSVRSVRACSTVTQPNGHQNGVTIDPETGV